MSTESVEKAGVRVEDASKTAVVGQFEVFMERIMDDALDEFEPFRVVNMNGMPGNDRVKKALSPVIRDELGRIRRSVEAQFDVVMEYIETGDAEGCRRDFLRNDVFYNSFDGDQSTRRRLGGDLTERMTRMGDDMAPLVETGENEFWDAVVAAYDEEEAREMLPRHFAYTETLKGYRGDLRLTVRVGGRLLGTEVEYTDEAMRVLDAAETKLREDLRDEVGGVYG
ncbi:MAG: hypothetical protein U5J64_04495 [Halobacteriales archaeon]|nr:hypothetical protein [Halobacteriales archaeon]